MPKLSSPREVLGRSRGRSQGEVLQMTFELIAPLPRPDSVHKFLTSEYQKKIFFRDFFAKNFVPSLEQSLFVPRGGSLGN